MKKTIKWILPAVLVLAAVLAVILLTPGTAPSPAESEPERSETYSWEEYQALSLEQQDEYYQQFSSREEFESWMASVRPAETTAAAIHWENSEKLPEEYTWEEYRALTPEEQEAFFLWFDSAEAFSHWRNSVMPEETGPSPELWENTKKLPASYSWEEYLALSPKEQEAFFQWFGSVEAFENWRSSVVPEETAVTVVGWDKPGKLPNAYTWEEYEALTPEEQDLFSLWFGSETAFDYWVNSVRPAETAPAVTVWNKPDLPNTYSWEAYQALTPQEQDAFFRWFGSVWAFENWMASVHPAETAPAIPAIDWEARGKLPDRYTWEEYQALTPQEQEAFFLWFGSVEAFERWMETAKAA